MVTEMELEMRERVVRVKLSAQVAEYQKGMLDAASATRTVGTEAEKLAQTKQAFESVGRGGVVMGSLIGAAVTVAVAKFAEFDAAMSNVNAATGETAANMEALRDSAIDLGASTVYSATEAANAIEELAKAGVSTSDILSGALAGSLDLAAAGQLGVARAAEITSTALNQYGLEGSAAAHVADVLAAGAGKAMGSVDDLANGLKFVGPVAASMGVSLEETTGVLALFAQQGIVGEQAGTSLRGVLSSLTSPSAQARGEIERLGLTLYDAQGNFLGLENAAGQLSNAYGNMNGASRDASLGIIFGRETVTAATALYKAGARGVDEWTTAVDDSGYAAEQARMRLDNLQGDLESLQGALDSALIQTGSAANETLRDMVQSVSGLVDIYNDLPEPVQDAVLYIGGATAAVTLFGGATMLAVPKVIEYQAAIRGAGLSMGSLSLAAGGAGLALGGLFAIVGEVARIHAEAQANARAYADTLEDGSNRITNATRELAQENLAAERTMLWMNRGSAYDAADKLGLSLERVTDAATGNVDALRELEDVIKAGGGEMDAAARVADKLGLSVTDVSGASTILREAILGENSSIEEAIKITEQKDAANRDVTGSTQGAAGAAKTAAAAYLEESGAVSGVADELSRLIDQINEANGIGQDAIAANIAYKDAMAKVDETIQKAREGVEGYGLTLDEGTQAGRDNLGMLLSLAQGAEDAAEKQFKLDGNAQAYRETLEASHQALVDRATAFYGNAEQAGALADQILRIPPDSEWTVIAQTQDAITKAEAFKNLWESIRNRTVTLSAVPTIGGGQTQQPGPFKDGYVFPNSANGNLFDYSGIHPAQRSGGLQKFAEPETVWESFISGKPDQRDRNVGIWQETGRRLGVTDGAGPGTTNNVTQNITALPGMDERAIADRMAARLDFGLR